jgi:hypothetical protein
MIMMINNNDKTSPNTVATNLVAHFLEDTGEDEVSGTMPSAARSAYINDQRKAYQGSEELLRYDLPAASKLKNFESLYRGNVV